jgi:hypothetical protein
MRHSHVPVDTVNYISIQKGVQLKPNLQHTGNLIGHGHDRPAACVIAQQYSSHRAFIFERKKHSARFEMLLLQVLYFLKKFALSLKLCNLKLHKSASVYNIQNFTAATATSVTICDIQL